MPMVNENFVLSGDLIVKTAGFGDVGYDEGNSQEISKGKHNLCIR